MNRKERNSVKVSCYLSRYHVHFTSFGFVAAHYDDLEHAHNYVTKHGFTATIVDTHTGDTIINSYSPLNGWQTPRR